MPAPARHMTDVAEALSIKYNNLVYEMQGEGVDVTVLSLGEAFFDIPLYGFDDLPYPAIFHYSHSRGLPELRELLGGYYRDEYGVPVDPDREIIVTAGSKVAIHMALMSLLDPGDEVIIHEPAWVSYVEQVKLCHGVPVTMPVHEDVRDVERYITPRSKVIVVNFPNNPRGLLLSRSDWAHLHEVAQRHDVYLLADEAYSDFLAPDAEFVSGALDDPDKAHTIVCNSMSKNYGMSGWRLGYVITNEALADEILKINQHLVTCPATILSYYLARHFRGLLDVTKPQIREVVEKRREVARYMDSRDLSYLPGEATFYLFVSIGDSELGSDDFCARLLRERHVCAVPGIGYGESCDRYIRVSVGAESMERTRRGVDAIADLVASTAPAGASTL